MNVWALSDPHLSFTRDKPMHVFGEHWRHHWEKIERHWRAAVAPADVVLVTGDVSWGWRLKDAMADLEWIHQLPGQAKLMVRGNHDHWWPKDAREASMLPSSLRLLSGEALRIGEEVFCGTGGWLAPEDPYFEPLDRPRYERELGLLERALERGKELAEGKELNVLLHFSPFTSAGGATSFEALLRRFPVKTVTFGHFHMEEEWRVAPRGDVGGIHFTLAAADFVDFAPVRLPL